MGSRLLLILLCAAPSHALRIDANAICQSRMIPTEGQAVTWTVPVVNDTAQAYQGDVTVQLRYAADTDEGSQAASTTAVLDLAPGGKGEVSLSWVPPHNGYYTLWFSVEGVRQVVDRRVAVTHGETFFAWFGAPRRLGWCNVPTTVSAEDTDWWLRRGAIPAAWRCGVCCQQLTVDEFVEKWGSAAHIAIDEVGGPGEVTDKFIAAWKKLKEQKPDQWIAVWCMGAHAYWRDVAPLIDLFLPEIYLNYGGNHLGRFDAYFRTAREAGVMSQVIPGLGINEIRDKEGKVTCSPTKADVLRQFRYVKRTAPELRGIGFFTSDSAPPGVAEYADELCEDYYIRPVVTIEGLPEAISLSGGAQDERRTATVTIRNVGGMDAHRVRLQWLSAEGQVLPRELELLPCGQSATLLLDLETHPGAWMLGFRVLPDASYTVLDGSATRTVVTLGPDLADAVPVVIPPGSDEPSARVSFASVPGPGPYRPYEADYMSFRPQDGPCAVLPPRPGMQEQLAAFPAQPASRREAAVVLKPGEATAQGTGLEATRDGDTLTVRNSFYTVRMNLAKDSIEAISPIGGMENVLQGAWEFQAAGHEGFGPAEVSELPGCLVVTIPYASEKASGSSQYVFLSYSPSIRIARDWRPKGEVALQYSGERCGLYQKGGSYALQGGVGAVVNRGELHDSKDYRDLLFGYLGEAPGPYSADRAGWIDFSYGAPDADGGLGVAIEYRWEDAASKEYDVTRLYDAADWLEVLHVWGAERTLSRPQRSCIYLVPHRSMPLSGADTVAPAQTLWNRLHRGQLIAAGELAQ